MKDTSRLKKRVGWIDYAKGIGIFLVVLGHVLRGLSDSIGLAYLHELHAIDAWIYAFHMPLFFFLSGLLSKGTEAKTVRVFLWDRVRSVLYPYLIWSALVGGLRAVSGQSGETLSSFIVNFWRIIYQPADIFWFLYSFFLISTIYFFLRRLNLAPVQILFGAVLLYGIYLLLPGVFFWHPLAKVAIYSNYFVLGALIGSWVLNQVSNPNTFLLTGAVCGFAILATAIYFNILTSQDPNLVLSSLGITSCVLLAKLFYQRDWLRFLKDWGYSSLQIYVAHTSAAAFIRIVLQKGFHIDSLLIHVVLGTAAGIYLPILLNWLVERINFRYLFTIPKNKKMA